MKKIKMLRRRNSLKISTKVVLSFIILVIIQAIISLIAITLLNANTSFDTLNTQMKRILIGVEGYLDQTLKDMLLKVELFAGQKKIIDYTDFGLKNLVERELFLFRESLLFDGIAIYVRPDLLFTHAGTIPILNSELTKNLDLAFLNQKPYFISKIEDDIKLAVICPIKRENNIIGALSLYINIDENFTAKLEKIINCRVIFVFDETYIYKVELPINTINNIKTEYEKSLVTENILKIEDYIIGYVSLSSLGNPMGKLFCLLDTKESMLLIQRYNLISLILTILILAAALFIGIIFYRITFFAPFQTLLGGIKKISEGNLKFPIKVLKNDEFGELAKAFDQMRINLINRQNELSQLSQYNTFILESIHSGVITVNLNKEITTFNPSARKILETDSGKQLMEKLNLNKLPEKLLNLLLKSVLEDIYFTAKEIPIINNGNKRILALTTSPLKSTDGKRLGIIATFDDITKLKKLEEKLSISKRLAALGEMAAGVAHQIRNPLAIMKVSGEMLRDNFKVAKKKTDYFKLTNMIVSEIETLNLVVRNFLDFARPREIKKTLHSIKDIIDQSLGTLPLDKYYNIKINTKIQKNMSKYKMDKSLMEQVISNLVLNALQVSQAGSAIEIRVFKRDKRLIIEVQDWGLGMDEQIKKNIFNPFFTTKDSGMGLGLSIVHRIVESHNGMIDVYSEKGLGTTFKIVI